MNKYTFLFTFFVVFLIQNGLCSVNKNQPAAKYQENDGTYQPPTYNKEVVSQESNKYQAPASGGSLPGSQEAIYGPPGGSSSGSQQQTYKSPGQDDSHQDTYQEQKLPAAQVNVQPQQGYQQPTQGASTSSFSSSNGQSSSSASAATGSDGTNGNKKSTSSASSSAYFQLKEKVKDKDYELSLETTTPYNISLKGSEKLCTHLEMVSVQLHDLHAKWNTEMKGKSADETSKLLSKLLDERLSHASQPNFISTELKPSYEAFYSWAKNNMDFLSGIENFEKYQEQVDSTLQTKGCQTRFEITSISESGAHSLSPTFVKWASPFIFILLSFFFY